MPVWPDPDKKEINEFIASLPQMDEVHWLMVIDRYAGKFTVEAEEAAFRIIRGTDLNISDKERDMRVAAAEPAFERVAEALADLPTNMNRNGEDIPYRQIATAAACAAVRAMMASPDLKPHIARVLTSRFDFLGGNSTEVSVRQ